MKKTVSRKKRDYRHSILNKMTAERYGETPKTFWNLLHIRCRFVDFLGRREPPPLWGVAVLSKYQAGALLPLWEGDVESRASGGAPSAPPCGELFGEPRELDMEPRLQTGPELSKTIRLPSKEPSAMP